MLAQPNQPISNPKLILLAVVFLAVVLGAIVTAPVGSPATPTITWTPSSLNETIAPGESNVVAVSFTSSENLSDVVARVVPELEALLTVAPHTFAATPRRTLRPSPQICRIS